MRKSNHISRQHRQSSSTLQNMKSFFSYFFSLSLYSTLSSSSSGNYFPFTFFPALFILLDSKPDPRKEHSQTHCISYISCFKSKGFNTERMSYFSGGLDKDWMILGLDSVMKHSSSFYLSFLLNAVSAPSEGCFPLRLQDGYMNQLGPLLPCLHPMRGNEGCRERCSPQPLNQKTSFLSVWKGICHLPLSCHSQNAAI